MTVLADDLTAAAILNAVPCYPVPSVGGSPAIASLRAAQVGHGFIIGQDGVMLILRRPWLALDMPVTTPVAADLPYGSVGPSWAELRCGLIPGEHLAAILDHFRAALPDEAAAFVLWDEATRAFSVHYPAIDEATPSRLVYRPPLVSPVCDVHSKGQIPAYFSPTDDADDAHATKVAVVIGRIADPAGPVMTSRLCAGGMFLPLPRSPFAGEYDAV